MSAFASAAVFSVTCMCQANWHEKLKYRTCTSS